MSTKTNKTAKTATKKVSSKTAKLETLTTEINLSKFTDKLKDVELKEKRTKDNIYVYPEHLTGDKKNSEEGKKFRNKLRNQLKRFANNIFVYAKTNNVDELKKEISLFETFYKENYRINDFSFASISNTKNETKEKDLKLMIEIISEVKGQNK